MCNWDANFTCDRTEFEFIFFLNLLELWHCRSRGFGFVTFAEAASLEECLGSRPHNIDGKEVECKRAIPREGMQQPLPELHVTSKKVVLLAVLTMSKVVDSIRLNF